MKSIGRLMTHAATRGGLLLAALGALLPPQPAAAQSDIVLLASSATRAGKWVVTTDSSAAGGKSVRHPNAGAAKVATALASPSNYFELTFNANANTPYRLWLRGKADSNHWANDSVFVQFGSSVTSSGSAQYRIGTSSALAVNLEECGGCGLSGWKWQDTGYGDGILGPTVQFATTGTHKIRVQTREDGLAVDQIVLSPSTYLKTRPTATNLTGTAPAPAEATTATDIKLTASAASVKAGKWGVYSDSTAVGGSKIRHPNAGASKVGTPLSSPSNYFELTFNAVAGTPYRLWVHGRADSDHYANDSVYVQFSGSVTSSGSATYRIGTTSATTVALEACDGCSLSGWKWEDNGWGKLGPAIYFATTGTQKIRVQTREDGMAIDQILLSPSTYLNTKPPQTSGGSTPTPTPAPAPELEPAPTSSSTLRVLTWNIHHGVGMDGKYDLVRIVKWIVPRDPHVIMITEGEYYTGFGYEDQAQRFKTLLQQQTGRTWYAHHAQEYGDWGAHSKTNILLSRFPFSSTGREVLSYDRSIAAGTIQVNGRNITVMTTHWDHQYRSRREQQARDTIAQAKSYVGPHIIAGDFNAWPDQTSIHLMLPVYYDSWAVAASNGVAVSFSGNSPFGATKNGRIDYIFYSRNSSVLKVLKSQVFQDPRDANGVRISDHRPLMTTFAVQ